MPTDPLDPTTSGTFVSRIVYVDMCEKLYDVGPRLTVVPQLATALPQVSKPVCVARRGREVPRIAEPTPASSGR